MRAFPKHCDDWFVRNFISDQIHSSMTEVYPILCKIDGIPIKAFLDYLPISIVRGLSLRTSNWSFITSFCISETKLHKIDEKK